MLPQSHEYPNLMVLIESVDSCAEIKECPFCGVTSSGRVWRKVPESDARSVGAVLCQTVTDDQGSAALLLDR